MKLLARVGWYIKTLSLIICGFRCKRKFYCTTSIVASTKGAADAAIKIF